MLDDIATEARLGVELARSQAYARAALESAPDAMVIVNTDEVIQLANGATEKLFGYKPGELVGHRADMLISAGRRNRHRNGRLQSEVGFFSKRVAGPMNAGLDLTGRRKDGAKFPVEISFSQVEAAAGFATVAIRDITARKRIEQDLRDANLEQLRLLNGKLVQQVSELKTLARDQQALHEELRLAQRQTAESLILLETLQSTAPVGFGFVDRHFRICRMNETLAALNGLALEEQLGRTVAELAPELWPQIGPIYAHVLETGETVINQDVQRDSLSANGHAGHWLTSYYPVRLNDEVIGVGLVVVDITDRDEAEDFRAVVLENMAEGLAVSDAEGLLVFMNGTASKMLGWTESELLGSSTHAAIHYQRADGSPLAEEDSALTKVRTEGLTVRVTDDAFTRKDGSIFPVAYSAAPLHHGASVRGAVVVFHDATEEQIERSRARRELDALSWVGRIRDALDDDRLVIYAQPIIPLSTRGRASRELLLRMIGQKGEVILPNSFLPVAEKYGQVWELDEWVIMRAAVLAAEGRLVHTNLSADTIGSLDLLPQIERALSAASADPANLVFEITETALMGNLEAGEALARGLTQLGCGLALDDFGTGYGSFTYLQKLPFKYLKIDIAFVRDLISSATSRHLVRAIVNIAREFGQQTIAEGVEDSETLDLLRDYGVDLAQGFHLGRPQPLELG